MIDMSSEALRNGALDGQIRKDVETVESRSVPPIREARAGERWDLSISRERAQHELTQRRPIDDLERIRLEGKVDEMRTLVDLAFRIPTLREQTSALIHALKQSSESETEQVIRNLSSRFSDPDRFEFLVDTNTQLKIELLQEELENLAQLFPNVYPTSRTPTRDDYRDALRRLEAHLVEIRGMLGDLSERQIQRRDNLYGQQLQEALERSGLRHELYTPVYNPVDTLKRLEGVLSSLPISWGELTNLTYRRGHVAHHEGITCAVWLGSKVALALLDEVKNARSTEEKFRLFFGESQPGESEDQVVNIERALLLTGNNLHTISVNKEAPFSFAGSIHKRTVEVLNDIIEGLQQDERSGDQSAMRRLKSLRANYGTIEGIRFESTTVVQ